MCGKNRTSFSQTLRNFTSFVLDNDVLATCLATRMKVFVGAVVAVVILTPVIFLGPPYFKEMGNVVSDSFILLQI